jgi:hypothetical protein
VKIVWMTQCRSCCSPPRGCHAWHARGSVNAVVAECNGLLSIAVQIYIVMMEPSDMYATYSCRLPSPVLL